MGWYDVLHSVGFTISSHCNLGGGFISDLRDVTKFGNAVMEGELVPHNILDEFWKPQKLTNGEELSYGLGWCIYSKKGMLFIQDSFDISVHTK